ncbi:MAG TPA: ATP synthase subunit I, partial [Mycobacterium sp.]
MTTPAQDAPLVFPSVAFRPAHLFILSIAITAVALVAAGLSGHLIVGVFFGVGLLRGLLNARFVRRSVASIPAK